MQNLKQFANVFTMNLNRLLFHLSKIFSKRYTSSLTNTYLTTKKLTDKVCHRYYSNGSHERTDDLYTTVNEDDFESFDEPLHYKDADFESLAGGDPELLKTLKIRQLEIDYLAQEGGRVPSQITSAQWLELASVETRTQRLKFIRFLWGKELKKTSSKHSSTFDETKLKRYQERKVLSTNSPVQYGLQHTTLFHRFYDQDMKKLFNFRLLQAMIHGPHIIVDCGFLQYMKMMEVTATVKQILRLWSRNREHLHPYDVIFCNYDPQSILHSRMCGVLPTMESDPTFPFNHTPKHYLDLYPKDKLVYLTPDSNELMEKYDHDSIYILGGIAERRGIIPLSLAKAKRDRLRMVKFPLDKYIKWTSGHKVLSLEQSIGILHDLKEGRDWKFALKRLSSRGVVKNNLMDDDEITETDTNTARYVEEYHRRKQIYNLLLDRNYKSK